MLSQLEINKVCIEPISSGSLSNNRCLDIETTAHYQKEGPWLWSIFVLMEIVGSYNVASPSYVCGFRFAPVTIVISTINHSEIGVMCTNLAIERGPHIVGILMVI
jgi:hypothetical protein